MEYTKHENTESGANLEEKLLHELSRLNERVAVVETKLDSSSDTLREILTQAKLTNGRVYRLEAQTDSLEERASANASGISDLKRAERGVLVAGWRVSLYIMAGAGAFAAAAVKFVEVLK